MPSPGRLGLSFSCSLLIASALMPACGFRTDPNSGALICVEADGGTETGAEAEAGSCGNPIEMPVIDGQIARGFVSGCSESDGICEASGGEQVFKLTSPGANDITLRFLPSETDINPVMRVIEVPAGDPLPCDESEASDELTCAPIITEVPARSFYTRGGFDYYVLVDTQAGEAGAFGFELLTGWQQTGTVCIDQQEVEPIILGIGGVYGWTSTLSEGHGIVGSGTACNAPGNETVFQLQTLDTGTLHVIVQSTSGGPPPVVGLRTSGCGGANQIACAEAEEGQTITQLDYFLEGPITRYLVVDNPVLEQNAYTFEAWLD